ncbi:MAG: ribosome silencing factor [Leptospiraceae bacterium]|nr:ribosome silencing factor [Leptospiraceae bacterium]
MSLKQETKTTSKKKTSKKATATDRKKILKLIHKILAEKKIKDIVILNLEAIHSYLSIFVIGTAENFLQARAVAIEIERQTKEFKLGRRNQERKPTDNGWVLIDLGEIIVHVMTEEKRRFYDLERLWRDAEVISI